MAFTEEQQARVDEQVAIEEARAAVNEAQEAKRRKLELIRLAANTLTSNRLDQPSGSREITAEDITSFSTTLISFIES
jgi:hypothetical protein